MIFTRICTHNTEDQSKINKKFEKKKRQEKICSFFAPCDECRKPKFYGISKTAFIDANPWRPAAFALEHGSLGHLFIYFCFQSRRICIGFKNGPDFLKRAASIFGLISRFRLFARGIIFCLLRQHRILREAFEPS